MAYQNKKILEMVKKTKKRKINRFELKFEQRPKIRHLKDMKMVLYDQKWVQKLSKKALKLELYYMYRSIKSKRQLRYDVTVIPANMLGEEFVKTKGHEHSPRKYGEIYTLLEGKAIYLLQKRKEEEIEDVYAIKAEKGEVVIIPSGYGHVTINPSKDRLVEGNWIDKRCKNDYGFFEKRKGACYFFTKEGWVKNENFKEVPPLRFEKARKSIMPDKSKFLYGKRK